MRLVAGGQLSSANSPGRPADVGRSPSRRAVFGVGASHPF